MKNKYEIRGDVTAIFIEYKNQKLEAIIDTTELDKAKTFPNSWLADNDRNTFYVYGVIKYAGDEKRTKERLHRYLLNCPQDKVVDHINGNGLDNRGKNLRIVTAKENSQNQILTSSRNKSSGKRGVTWHKNSGKWLAYFKINGKVKSVGLYDNIDEAEKDISIARSLYVKYSRDGQLVDHESIPTHIKNLFDDAPPRRDNRSGFRNVYWQAGMRKWCVKITRNKKGHIIGYFEDLEEAARNAEEARKKYGIG